MTVPNEGPWPPPERRDPLRGLAERFKDLFEQLAREEAAREEAVNAMLDEAMGPSEGPVPPF